MPDIESPYEASGTWLRGNVHTHTTASDGACPADVVVEDYAARGYDFLAISDHDTFVDPSEYRDGTDAVLLPAVEVSEGGPHLLHLGAEGAVTPRDDRRAVVDEIRERGGLAVAAHPRWKEEYAHWSRATLERLDGFAGIEIYNGLIENHPGAAFATDRWDRLLSSGRRVWGYATDDAHRPREIGRGWIAVQADERTPAAILDALAAGRFYASTGVTIRSVRTSGEEVVVETDGAQRIRLVSDHGCVQQTVDGSSAAFRVPGQLVHGSDHTYVRIECVGPAGAMAWTQPLFLE